MSRIGKKPVIVPANIKVSLSEALVSIEGPKGKLDYALPEGIKVSLKDNVLIVERSSEEKKHVSLHGLVRSLLVNMIKGVSEGYEKALEIKGVGFKAQINGNVLEIALGFSHPVKYSIPEEVTVQAAKPTQLKVSGIDKVKVGEVAAEIRSFFKAEPYTGKGIRYVGEYVRRKAGKTVTK